MVIVRGMAKFYDGFVQSTICRLLATQHQELRGAEVMARVCKHAG
jgi:hypothetical protein